jgi:hypothetical protein
MRVSAQDGGDIRGWFHLISATHAEPNLATCRAFPKKRLKGFEPSTFCMAITPVSETGGQRILLRAGVSAWRERRHGSAIGGDVRRYAAIWELRRRSARNARGRFDFRRSAAICADSHGICLARSAELEGGRFDHGRQGPLDRKPTASRVVESPTCRGRAAHLRANRLDSIRVTSGIHLVKGSR